MTEHDSKAPVRSGRYPLRLHPALFGMVRLAPDAAWAEFAPLLGRETCFFGRTEGECSLIAPLAVLGGAGAAVTPASSGGGPGSHAGAFRLLSIDAVFGTTETGILLELLAPLAEAGVWVLAVGTHDTDHVLVRSDQLDEATVALAAAGWPVIEGSPPA